MNIDTKGGDCIYVKFCRRVAVIFQHLLHTGNTLMMWLGMSKIDAYLTAYPTNASRVSIAAMATRKSQEEWIADYLDALWKAETDGKIKFNPLP